MSYDDERRDRQEKEREERREREADVFYEAWRSGMDPDRALSRYQDQCDEKDPIDFVKNHAEYLRKQRETRQQEEEQQEDEEQ